ncbi:MAG: flagellar export chaperone FliS [Dechloromonas sp.]|jgi:flagellar protein FliS|uniref:flagellar export chaperone FliS n=1 Tax=Dechloromonas sp. CZR5 TaxID=2608630 RepID=UPI00123DCFC4|nr:flagellar export chaperone FliS [Dechloromonas sp. CZR5]MBL8405356.1 flagellar export chaperone FliS [Dechloromonas sp.]
MFSNPIAAYRRMDLESDVLGADPHRLIVLLFDGAEAALARAQTCLAAKDINGKSDALVKAIEIINDGLAASLNTESGGELAGNLKALYDYMVSRLIHANAHMDPVAVSEVQKLLGEIAGAWRELGVKLRQPSQPG